MLEVAGCHSVSWNRRSTWYELPTEESHVTDHPTGFKAVGDNSVTLENRWARCEAVGPTLKHALNLLDGPGLS